MALKARLTSRLSYVRQLFHPQPVTWRNLVRCVLDGNILQQVLRAPEDARLVGIDYQGNKYFESKKAQTGRERWVFYKPAQDGIISGERRADAEQIPPEWYNWLHRVQDEPPVGDTAPWTPIYHARKDDAFLDKYAHSVGRTMAEPLYTGRAVAAPKGAWGNLEKRNWRKVQVWQPSSSAQPPSNSAAAAHQGAGEGLWTGPALKEGGPGGGPT